MKAKKLAPILAVAIVAVVGAVWWNWSDGGAGDAISVSGNIELTQVEISFKTGGRIVELAVQEGDEVKMGQTVARLDDEQLLWRRQQAAASLVAAESRLAEIQAQVRYLAENAAGQIQQRRAEERQAEARLAELRSGARRQEIEQAKAAVDRAASQFEKASSDWRRAEELFKDQDISQVQHDQFRSAFETAQASLEQARQQLDLVREGPRAEDVEAAEAALERAGAGVRLAESLTLEVERARRSERTVAAEIERARALVSQLDSELEDSRVVSPIDGVVLSKNAEPGEVVAPATSVVSVGDVARPWLRGYIPEQSLGRIKLGAAARVTTDSHPDKVYPGTITFISSEAEFTPKQIQTAEERVKLVYRIKISLENPDRELKLNMPCDAEIRGL